MTVPVVLRAAWQGLVALACACSVVSCAAPIDRSDLPSPEYEDTVRAFYQGLAALDVGLLEDAEISFERAAALSPDEPAIYRDAGPAWTDPNLRELTRVLESRIFFAHVRASTGAPNIAINCHPFRAAGQVLLVQRHTG